ncbi:trehalose-phosphatase [Chelatococcus sambhunathii]|uniref:Trehalose 6-phosphate phosphatase n=1 Tax=Chelatococcus sambhunathii TaxID=363953 RepID=A0ABU1DKQ0_9HYPH|nr:trehalose-phosphatase [Chelatococcus sambhunathii]MDR4308722.1 trehalose-phosphatase [Chelatococcus sambhunathii]
MISDTLDAPADRAKLPSPETGREYGDRLAFFLDLDGTVLDIAPTPEGVSIPHSTVEAISRISDRLGGALAVISGRSLADIDKILAPLRLPAAALHGAELRRLGGGRAGAGHGVPPERLTAALGAFVDARPGLRLEDKGASVAVHYRATPEREDEVRTRVGELVDRFAPGHELQPGKMVVEVRPRGCDKGAALKALMEHPPFAGRIPWAFGDDLTDEFALEAALALGGEGVLVGAVDRPTAATAALESPAAMRDWLERLAAG